MRDGHLSDVLQSERQFVSISLSWYILPMWLPMTPESAKRDIIVTALTVTAGTLRSDVIVPLQLLAVCAQDSVSSVTVVFSLPQSSQNVFSLVPDLFFFSSPGIMAFKLEP